MSTVQEIKAAIKALPKADFREMSRAVDQMEAERFDCALEMRHNQENSTRG
jgi:hypothetical protein